MLFRSLNKARCRVNSIVHAVMMESNIGNGHKVSKWTKIVSPKRGFNTFVLPPGKKISGFKKDPTRESSSVGKFGRSACNLHALDLLCPGPFNCWPGIHVKTRKFD